MISGGRFEWTRIVVLETQLSRGEGWDLINSFHTATFWAYPDLDFQRHMLWSFLSSVSEGQR